MFSAKNLNRKGSWLLLVLIPGVIFLLVSTKPENAQALKQSMPIQVETTLVERRDLFPQLNVVGKIQSLKKIILRAETGGRIVERHFESGMSVQQNDLLLRIEDDDLKDTLQQVKARIEQENAMVKRDQRLLSLAKKNLKLQQNEVTRIQKLGDQALSSASQLGGASQQLIQLQAEEARLQFSVDSANSRIQQLEAELSQITRKIESTNIRAPFSGVINKYLIDVGDYVTPNQNLAEVVSRELEMKATISASVDEDLKLGQELSLMVSGHTYIGHLRSMQHEADVKTNTRQFNILLNSQELRSGEIATVDIPLRKHTQAIVVPVTAVLHDNGSQYLFTVQDDVVHLTAVVLGRRSGSHQVIESGVSENTTIVARDVAALSDQQKVHTRPLN